jgi:Protein of unknown function (DUF1579)
MNAEPQKQHKWLDRFIGEWTSEVDYSMGTEPPTKTIGTEVVRSLGGVWIIAEGEGGEDGCAGKTIITLGYDTEKSLFVGTFIASMMTFFWHYRGSLDADEKILTLDTEGPNFSQTAISKYQDIIEFVSDDHRVMKSQILEDSGKWNHFMTANYRRQK